ncbi:MAG: ParB/RepB/Spo0J family partition protein [Planctomycetota bacterium]
MTNLKKDKPKHLGRGLQSLLGPIRSEFHSREQVQGGAAVPLNMPADKELQEAVRAVRIVDIISNPHQPRMVWDERDLSELAESIKVNGLVQPIVVRVVGGKYQIIAGERRFRAAEMAGLEKVPAYVREASEQQMLELALVENIHRRDLNPLERAKAYRHYLGTFGMTQAEASQRLAEDRSVIANYLRLLDLPRDIQQMMVDGQISMGHARAILALPSDELRRKLANRAMAGRLSVREVERLVKRLNERGTKSDAGEAGKAPHIVDLENRLSSMLATKVHIDARKGGRRGKITIDFYSLDEFDRITEKLGLGAGEEVQTL